VGDRTNVFTLALRDADEADLAMMTMQPELAVTMDFEKATEAVIALTDATGTIIYDAVNPLQTVPVGHPVCDSV
jgi:hypothetical protein